jgi:hypothetical protein
VKKKKKKKKKPSFRVRLYSSVFFRRNTGRHSHVTTAVIIGIYLPLLNRVTEDMQRRAFSHRRMLSACQFDQRCRQSQPSNFCRQSAGPIGARAGTACKQAEAGFFVFGSIASVRSMPTCEHEAIKTIIVALSLSLCPPRPPQLVM